MIYYVIIIYYIMINPIIIMINILGYYDNYDSWDSWDNWVGSRMFLDPGKEIQNWGNLLLHIEYRIYVLYDAHGD